MRISQEYPSKYLKAGDLGGQDRTVRIRACVKEELGQGSEKESKPVLYFEGHTKGLVCPARPLARGLWHGQVPDAPGRPNTGLEDQ